MTDKKEQIAKIFHEAWHNTEVEAKNLHVYILEQLISKGFATPDSILNEEGVRKSYESLGKAKGFDYSNYRKRPRKGIDTMVFDFEDDEIQAEIRSIAPIGELVNVHEGIEQRMTTNNYTTDF